MELITVLPSIYYNIGGSCIEVWKVASASGDYSFLRLDATMHVLRKFLEKERSTKPRKGSGYTHLLPPKSERLPHIVVLGYQNLVPPRSTLKEGPDVVRTLSLNPSLLPHGIHARSSQHELDSALES